MDLLPDNGKGYLAFLDNLFTNVKLLKYSRAKGWSIIGTASGKSGIYKDFIVKKTEDAKKDQIPWGTLYSKPSEDSLINYFAWKDNALVLFMSTISPDDEYIERLRKRPSETSTSAKMSRVPFGDHSRKNLSTPKFDDQYNHSMGYVNQGSQLKQPNCCQKICRKGGQQSLVCWLLDTCLVNSYLLSFYFEVPNKQKYTSQTAFRESIIEACFTMAKQAKQPRTRGLSIDCKAQLDIQITNYSITKRQIPQECMVCKVDVGLGENKQRVVLGEIQSNIYPISLAKLRPKRTSFGCNICNTPLCKIGSCFNRFHSLEWNNR
jgi:hypothetical protein